MDGYMDEWIHGWMDMWMDMWSDFPKCDNFDVHLPPPLNGYNNRLTVHMCTTAKNSTVYFSEASLVQSVWRPEDVLKWSINGMDKKTAGMHWGNHHTTY